MDALERKQAYVGWFTTYPRTHERAGQTVEVVTREWADAQVNRVLNPDHSRGAVEDFERRAQAGAAALIKGGVICEPETGDVLHDHDWTPIEAARVVLEAADTVRGAVDPSGVWHKDGPLAQIEAMIEWLGKPYQRPDDEHIGKVQTNLRVAVAALRGAVDPSEVDGCVCPRGTLGCNRSDCSPESGHSCYGPNAPRHVDMFEVEQLRKFVWRFRSWTGDPADLDQLAHEAEGLLHDA